MLLAEGKHPLLPSGPPGVLTAPEHSPVGVVGDCAAVLEVVVGFCVVDVVVEAKTVEVVVMPAGCVLELVAGGVVVGAGAVLPAGRNTRSTQ